MPLLFEAFVVTPFALKVLGFRLMSFLGAGWVGFAGEGAIETLPATGDFARKAVGEGIVIVSMRSGPSRVVCLVGSSI